MELIQKEVRLYFLGRTDWDTEFFTSSCPTETMVKASEIARKARANHYNFGLATPEEAYQHRGPRVRSVKGLGASATDQVKAIEGFLGLGTERE